MHAKKGKKSGLHQKGCYAFSVLLPESFSGKKLALHLRHPYAGFSRGPIHILFQRGSECFQWGLRSCVSDYSTEQCLVNASVTLNLAKALLVQVELLSLLQDSPPSP